MYITRIPYHEVLSYPSIGNPIFKPYGNIYFTLSNSYLFMYISLTYLLNKLSSHLLYASCKGMNWPTCLRRYIVFSDL